MRELRSTDSFTITGRGKAYTFKPMLWKPPPAVGEVVMIDGAIHTIAGIERHPLACTEETYWSFPRAVGLLVSTATKVWWRSICSNHRDENPDCPRCKVGIWSHIPPETD